MRVFVTVGTTAFDELVQAADEAASEMSDKGFVFQIADGSYIPRCGKWFSYSADVDDEYGKADLVVCHAGAGSIYRLLEMGKKILVVPNTFRVDHHQLDIARYMDNQNCVTVCYDLTQLSRDVLRAVDFSPSPFNKEEFFLAEEIGNYLNGSLI